MWDIRTIDHSRKQSWNWLKINITFVLTNEHFARSFDNIPYRVFIVELLFNLACFRSDNWVFSSFIKHFYCTNFSHLVAALIALIKCVQQMHWTNLIAPQTHVFQTQLRDKADALAKMTALRSRDTKQFRDSKAVNKRYDYQTREVIVFLLA